jgi:hypothetical protein
MVVSFNWYKYSVVIGFLKKRVKTAAIPETDKARRSGKFGWFDKFRPSDKCGAADKCRTFDKFRPDKDFFHLANEVKIELKLGIRKSAIKKEGKWELLLSIRRLLAPYTALTASQAYPFRVAINNTIIAETARYCSIHLSSEDLSGVWR